VVRLPINSIGITFNREVIGTIKVVENSLFMSGFKSIIRETIYIYLYLKLGRILKVGNAYIRLDLKDAVIFEP
jgi:hypothetical protein